MTVERSEPTDGDLKRLWFEQLWSDKRFQKLCRMDPDAALELVQGLKVIEPLFDDQEQFLTLVQGKFSSTYALWFIRLGDPDVARGKKIIAAAAEGGRTRRRGPSDEVLCVAVTALHDRNPNLSWSDVCERVGKQFKLSRRTVANRAKAADWRTPR